MNWYYAEAGQQKGPVSQEQLNALAQSGTIQADTLVWREGMDNWKPYAEVLGSAPAPAPLPAPLPAGPPPENAVICAQCGNMFGRNEVIRYGDQWVCATCKPLFVQRLKEGVAVAGAMDYAGFWTRFAAVFLDGIILWVVNVTIGVVFGFGIARAAGFDSSGGFTALQIVLTFIQMGIGLSYETFMIGRFGATLGKMACKIKVVTADGKPVSYARAIGRYFSKLLSGMICLIGYIIAAFDGEKRALHDHICSTRVIRTG